MTAMLDAVDAYRRRLADADAAYRKAVKPARGAYLAGTSSLNAYLGAIDAAAADYFADVELALAAYREAYSAIRAEAYASASYAHRLALLEHS